MASSSSSSVPRKYQVFLSFRGEDTRNSFTSHLDAALKRKGIDAYVDYKLERGEKIETFFTVIEESTISIIVLSKNYASSSWCLDELCKILECMEKDGQKVVPIFYHVDPSDVRKQGGSFEKAFAEHVKNRPDKVERWRAAFKEVADISGFHLTAKPNDRLESEVVEEIAQVISKKFKLICKSFIDTKGLVGIDSLIKKIELLLRSNSKDVRIVGIWGMGGIGKTTIAEAIYNQFFDEFEGHCFVNVTEEEVKNGRVHLRQKIFSEILRDENLNVGTNLVPPFIIDRLQRKKVFFVLDDVNDPEQLDLLSLKFGCGSRIIVTSRDKQLLEPVVDVWYEVRGLIDHEALQLFSLCAFKQNHPKDDFVELSKEVVRYVGGVPLALRVFGSSLYGKKLEFWKGDLKKLKEIPNPKIDKILRISYDGLDGEVKDMFLDIAYFFNWENRDHVEEILDGCYISVISGIGILIDRSLLTISFDNKIKMHNLLQQMAWNIIRQESKKSGKRSRLWTLEDISPVLENNTGTESVKGMLLDMSKINRRVFISPTAFARMRELKILKFYYSRFYSSSLRRERKAFLEKGLESFPGVLRYLHWDEYPSKSLPSNFCPESLVELRMPNSDVERLWDGVQNLVKLKFLDLSGSQYLIKISDLSKATNLEAINLGGCSNITKFPEIPENLVSLDLGGTAIEEVPSSIGLVSPLRCLDLRDCRRLERLPSSICKLKFLEALHLEGCLKLGSFPEISETMESLEYLNLSRTSIEELHSSIENLVALWWLGLDYCEKLKNLPSSIGELKSLEMLSVINCLKLGSVPRNNFMLNCHGKWELTVSGFSKLEVIEELLGTVEVLNIHPSNETTYESGTLSLDCSLFAFPGRLMDMSSLTKLNLSRNDFEIIPICIKQLLQLDTLDLRYCERLQSLPPELPPNLQYLYAYGCKSLEEVSSAFPIFSCEELRFMFINCLKLDQNCIDWVKTLVSIQQKATEDVKLYLEGRYRKSSVTICFPGSEIPEWFRCKSQGSFVTIQLPSHLHHDNKFVGFTVCVVLPFNGRDLSFLDVYLCVSCRYNFKTNQRVFNEHVFNKPIRSLLDIFKVSEDFECIVGDHVFLGYDLDSYLCWYNEESKHHLTEASFEFSVCNLYGEDLSDYCTVKECGVCLLYAQDDFPHQPSEESNSLMIQPNSPYDPTWLSLKCGVINQDFVEPMVEDGTIINHESGSFDLNAKPSSSYDPTWLSLKCGVINQDSVDLLVEEEEPQRKRMKTS